MSYRAEQTEAHRIAVGPNPHLVALDLARLHRAAENSLPADHPIRRGILHVLRHSPPIPCELVELYRCISTLACQRDADVSALLKGYSMIRSEY
jgi:hypothetical protein